MKKVVVLCMLMLFLWVVSPAYADNSNWSDDKYDFKNIKTVYVADALSEGKPAVNYDSAENIVNRDVIKKLSAKYPAIHFITYAQLRDLMQKDAPDVNLDKLQNDDPEAYQKYVAENQGKYCDAVLQISIASMGYSHSQMNMKDLLQNGNEQVWSKSSSHSSSNTTFNSDGSTTTRTTTTTTSVSVNAPSTDQIVAAIVGTDFTNMGLRMRLLDSKSNKPIWTYTDIRSRGNPMLMKVTSPENMLDRILNDSFGTLNKVFSR